MQMDESELPPLQIAGEWLGKCLLVLVKPSKRRSRWVWEEHGTTCSLRASFQARICSLHAICVK